MITSRMSAYISRTPRCASCDRPGRRVRRRPVAGPNRRSTTACHSGTRAESGRPTTPCRGVGARGSSNIATPSGSISASAAAMRAPRIGIVDQRVEQRVGMTAVVPLLAERPRGDGAHARVRRSGELLPPQLLGRVVQPVADERVRPLGARRLDEPARAVVGRIAAKREGVDGLGARRLTGRSEITSS